MARSVSRLETRTSSVSPQKMEPQLIEITNGIYFCYKLVPPREEIAVLYVAADAHVAYEPICYDFGPPSIAAIHRFNNFLEEKEKEAKKEGRKIVIWCTHTGNAKANAAVLVGAFLVLVKGKSPEDAYLPLSVMHSSYSAFRDASSMPTCTYKMTVSHCLMAISRAASTGIYSPTSFNVNEFEQLGNPFNGDVTQIVPGKLVAFSGPSLSSESRFLHRFTPAHYLQMFRNLNVSHVVRLNNKLYPASAFTRNGIEHVELFFADGSAPPLPIAKQFLELTDPYKETDKCSNVAIHCKAGLGRTGTLIALYMMYYLRWPAAAAMAWVRIARPGSIMGMQHFFLMQMDDVIFQRTKDVPKEWAFFAKQPHMNGEDDIVSSESKASSGRPQNSLSPMTIQLPRSPLPVSKSPLPKSPSPASPPISITKSNLSFPVSPGVKAYTPTSYGVGYSKSSSSSNSLRDSLNGSKLPKFVSAPVASPTKQGTFSSVVKPQAKIPDKNVPSVSRVVLPSLSKSQRNDLFSFSGNY